MSVRTELLKQLSEQGIAGCASPYTMECGYVLDVAFPSLKIGIKIDSFQMPDREDWTIYHPSTNTVKCGMAVNMIKEFIKSSLLASNK